MDNEIKKAERASTTSDKVSPIDSALAKNGEIISTLEKQVEVLNSRLNKISNPTPSPSDKEHLAPSGASDVACTIDTHGSRLSTLSDYLSNITYNLEI